MIPLGSTVSDKISGWVGIVTGRSEYLFQSPNVMVTPKEIKDGQPIGGAWFDESRFEVIEERRPGLIGFTQ